MGGYQNPNEKEIDLPFPLIALTISHIVQKHQSGRESCYLNVHIADPLIDVEIVTVQIFLQTCLFCKSIPRSCNMSPSANQTGLSAYRVWRK